jgi:uracil-DNA glycosylase
MKMPQKWADERARKILNKVEPQAKIKSTVLGIWRNRPPLPAKLKPEIPRMEVLRGDPNSDMCIIAPPPKEADYTQGTPLSSPHALRLHELLLEIGINTQRCCVFSCARFGFKANKASVADHHEAFRKMIALRQFQLYLTVGDDAFKHFFARGKKPTPSIFGNILYIAEVGHKPVFALPEMDGLHVITPNDPRARANLLDWQDKVERRFREMLEVLQPVVEKLK